MVGGDLLVAPPGVKGGPRPRGAWRPLHLVDGDREDRLQACLFAREGSIIPLGPVVQHTDEAPEGATTLLVVPGEGNLARGRLYHDEGDGFGYRDGEYRYVTYEAKLQGDVADLKILEVQGRRAEPRPNMSIEVLCTSGERRPLKTAVN